MVDTRYGMVGRVLTCQIHPWECPTNYATLVSARCNVDAQDMRRVVPPRLWLPAEELEPIVAEDDDVAHGTCPQRLRCFSVGHQDTWGWMQ